MSGFQIGVIIFFVIAGVFALLVFSGILPWFQGDGREEAVPVSLWGTFSNKKIPSFISGFNSKDKRFALTYSEKNFSTYKQELTNAMASGNSPDIFIISQDAIFMDKNKIFTIPFESYNERDFLDAYIDSAKIFIDSKEKKVIGVPLAVDPIVLYWNRDLFSSSGIAKPPQYWDEFLKNVEILAKRDGAGNITQAGAALGEFNNVKNAKEILSMLILQTGNPIINSDTMEIIFGEKGDSLIDPAENTVSFFNEFSNPNKSVYTWNEALQDSDKMFASGSLAMYFGYASEIEDIRQKNPHLNFDIVSVPQIKDGKIKVTFAKIYGLVMPKNSKNQQIAFKAIMSLTGKNFSKEFSLATGLGSARRDVLAEGAKDPILSIIYNSSIMSRTWLEPDPEKISDIFGNMVQSVSTGKSRIPDAIRYAKGQIKELVTGNQ